MWSRISITSLGVWLPTSAGVFQDPPTDYPASWIEKTVGALAMFFASTRLGGHPPRFAIGMFLLGGALFAVVPADLAQTISAAHRQTTGGLLKAMCGLGP